MPIRQRSGSIDGQRERRAVRAREQAVEQGAGRLARFELELQDRRASSIVICNSRQIVRAVQVECELRVSPVSRAFPWAVAMRLSPRGCEREAVDRQPLEYDGNGRTRRMEVVAHGVVMDGLFSIWQNRIRSPRCRAEIANHNIGAVAVADIDPVDFVGAVSVPLSPAIATVKSGSLIVRSMVLASHAWPPCVCSSPKQRRATQSPARA